MILQVNYFINNHLGNFGKAIKVENNNIGKYEAKKKAEKEGNEEEDEDSGSDDDDSESESDDEHYTV